jgi:hypothetical protein
VLDAVINEGALRRMVGGAAVMRDQLAHLGTMQDLPNVVIRVLPTRTSCTSTSSPPATT